MKHGPPLGKREAAAREVVTVASLLSPLPPSGLVLLEPLSDHVLELAALEVDLDDQGAMCSQVE